MTSNDKKNAALGMNASSARHRLVKDTLFRLAIDAGHKCHHCGLDLDRATFSIEHKTPWLNATDSMASFFDQANIAFSHLSCNSAAGAKMPRKPIYTREELRERKRASTTPARRRDKYLRLGT